MAGLWLPMRLDLAYDPAVIGMAAALGIEEDAVVGKLHRLWSWANQQLQTGHTNVTASWVNRYVSCQNFAEKMAEQRWLAVNENGTISFPKFDRWNSEGAKNRLNSAERQRKSRRKNVTDMSQNKRDKSVTIEEKRREENKNPLTPTGDGQPAASQKRKNRSPAESRPEESDPVFVAFWSRYPRKEAKPKAAVAFAAAVAGGVPAAEIMAGLERWRLSEQWAKDGGKFIPHSTTFLNQRRWQDNPRPETLTAAPAPTTTFRDVILPKGTILPPER
jgi:hypothetical protein